MMSASMDVPVPEITDNPHSHSTMIRMEECECPDQYSGSSCQSCSPGHYRDYSDYACKECPCNTHEDVCQQDAIHGEVVCTCDRGWVGQFCDTRPIDVRIRGPLVQSVRPGETVKFNCGAKPQIKIEVRDSPDIALIIFSN